MATVAIAHALGDRTTGRRGLGFRTARIFGARLVGSVLVEMTRLVAYGNILANAIEESGADKIGEIVLKPRKEKLVGHAESHGIAIVGYWDNGRYPLRKGLLVKDTFKMPGSVFPDTLAHLH